MGSSTFPAATFTRETSWRTGEKATARCFGPMAHSTRESGRAECRTARGKFTWWVARWSAASSKTASSCRSLPPSTKNRWKFPPWASTTFLAQTHTFLLPTKIGLFRRPSSQVLSANSQKLKKGLRRSRPLRTTSTSGHQKEAVLWLRNRAAPIMGALFTLAFPISTIPERLPIRTIITTTTVTANQAKAESASA